MKILPTLRTKKQLYEFYCPEINRRNLRYWLNEIIAEHRPHASKHTHNLTFKEFLTFVARYGTPQGYELSPYLKEEIIKRGIKS